ncbi:MAG: FAD-dependent oxidoreductase, partial [Candidatus Nitrotoga sp.]
MTQIIEIKVPDIGDFKDVPVIAVLVKAGEKIAVEQTLLTLETDKATVDVPSPSAGVVKELKLKQWDKVNTGSVILTLEVADAMVTPTFTPAPQANALASAPGNTPTPAVAIAPPIDKDDPVPKGDWHAEVVVIGAGPGGYTAAFRAADLGKQVILIERHSRLGGVCLNVGCIPSKALLHVAKVIAEADDAAHHGVEFSKPAINIDKVRSWKDDVVGKLTGGLSMLAKQRKVQVVTGTAQFSSAHSVIVQTADGAKTITFDNVVIAAGSSVARIPGLPYDDPRLIDSTGALLLQDIPARLLIIGGGIIGLEMATVYDALGSKITLVELADGLMPGADRDLVRALHKRIEKRYEAIYLKTKVTQI